MTVIMKLRKKQKLSFQLKQVTRDINPLVIIVDISYIDQRLRVWYLALQGATQERIV